MVFDNAQSLRGCWRRACARPRVHETIHQNRRRQHDHEKHVVAEALSARLANRRREAVLLDIGRVENAISRDALPVQHIRCPFDRRPTPEERFFLRRLVSKLLALEHRLRNLIRISLPKDKLVLQSAQLYTSWQPCRKAYEIEIEIWISRLHTVR